MARVKLQATQRRRRVSRNACSTCCATTATLGRGSSPTTTRAYRVERAARRRHRDRLPLRRRWPGARLPAARRGVHRASCASATSCPRSYQHLERRPVGAGQRGHDRVLVGGGRRGRRILRADVRADGFATDLLGRCSTSSRPRSGKVPVDRPRRTVGRWPCLTWLSPRFVPPSSGDCGDAAPASISSATDRHRVTCTAGASPRRRGPGPAAWTSPASPRAWSQTAASASAAGSARPSPSVLACHSSTDRRPAHVQPDQRRRRRIASIAECASASMIALARRRRRDSPRRGWCRRRCRCGSSPLRAEEQPGGCRRVDVLRADEPALARQRRTERSSRTSGERVPGRGHDHQPRAQERDRGDRRGALRRPVVGRARCRRGGARAMSANDPP